MTAAYYKVLNLKYVKYFLDKRASAAFTTIQACRPTVCLIFFLVKKKRRKHCCTQPKPSKFYHK